MPCRKVEADHRADAAAEHVGGVAGEVLEEPVGVVAVCFDSDRLVWVSDRGCGFGRAGRS